ncbi:MAG: hypothetical protein ACERKK_08355 [Poseidonibacter sp.]|uniref:hypothetical protein n=1 Tax=Poseidonibacter sp. TaxID=2321188 RepID=UPI00359DB23F
MKEYYFPVKTTLDIELFKANKKFNDLNTLTRYLSNEYKIIKEKQISDLEYKYCNLFYKNILVYKHINTFINMLKNAKINNRRERDILYNSLNNCIYVNYEYLDIDDKKLKSLFYKIKELVNQISYEIFSDKYTYIKDELLEIREYLIKNSESTTNDIKIANNLWAFLKNLNYSYYNELSKTEEKISQYIIEYLLVESELHKFIKDSLLKSKELTTSKVEKIYIDFIILINIKYEIIFDNKFVSKDLE